VRPAALLLGPALLAVASAASAADYLFIGIYRHPSSGPKQCPKFELLMEEFANEADAKARGREFFRNDQYRDPHADLFKPRGVSLVYQYQGRTQELFGPCVVTKYGTVQGADEAEARRRLAAHVSEFRKYFASEPQVIRAWPAAHSTFAQTPNRALDRLTRRYDGVEITYVSGRSDSGRTSVVAQIHNPHPDRLARVFFRVNGRLLDTPADVDPRGSANFNLGRDVEHFGAAVRLLDPQATHNRGFIDVVKDAIRDEVTIKDGKLQRPVAGARG
jgi:hypothetical protein